MTEQVLDQLAEKVEIADAILIGAGSGLSSAAGYNHYHWMPALDSYLREFREYYRFASPFADFYYCYSSPEQQWAYYTRYIYSMWHLLTGQPYLDLRAVLAGKDYFVLTTNVDHCFQKAGFDKHRLFYTQGDYGLWQCSRPCHDKTYDNQEAVRQMVEAQGFQVTERGLLPPAQPKRAVPTELVPRCPVCGAPMSMNLRADDTFVQDDGWYRAAQRYEWFLRSRKELRVVFLELGVGYNTPGIIKYPFWQMTAANPRATYVCVNSQDALCPREIEQQSLCIQGDIHQVLEQLVGK